MPKSAKIRDAFYAANKFRPYRENSDLVIEATPPGGEWHTIIKDDIMCVTWGGKDVFHVNPHAIFDRLTEGQVAMAARDLPVMDGALRAIIVLSADAENLELIRELATSVIAHVELPAPTRPRTDIDEDDVTSEG